MRKNKKKAPMPGTRISRRGRSEKAGMQSLRNARGVTLIELLVAMVIASIVILAMYGVYQSSSKAATKGSIIANVQENLRASLEFMANDIRLAGLDGDLDRDPTFGILTAGTNQISLTIDRNLNNTLDDIAFGAVDGLGNPLYPERITYQVQNGALVITINGGADTQTLVQGVQNLSFQYLDGSGTVTATLNQIRTVVISMTVQQSSGAYGEVTRTLSKRVKCRNLGL